MFYLIGLGMNERSISLEALEILKDAYKVYLENYTVDFPYSKEELEKKIGRGILDADREFVESEEVLKEAGKKDAVLLVYGSPLAATTHISLIETCRKKKIKYQILHNASIFDVVSESGLQAYSFGKTASIPEWKENFQPKSFVDVIRKNQIIKAHTLLLVDIGLSLNKALEELKIASEERKLELDKIIICSAMGNKKQRVYYGRIKEFINKKVGLPFCIIIPGKLNFAEEEALKSI